MLVLVTFPSMRYCGIPSSSKSRKRDGEESAHGVSFAGKAVAGNEFHHTCESFQLGDFVLGIGEDKVCVP